MAERSKHTGDWSPLPKVTTVPIIVPVPESRTVVQAVFVERNSARQHVDDARKDALIIRKNSVQTMKSHRLKSPFVCNACDHRLRCRLRRMLYDAKYAQQQYEQMLSESRKGISLTEQELNRINDTITPLLKKGQSLPVICEHYRDELPVSDRTIYSYIDAGLLDARNIDLRRKLRRKERSGSQGRSKMPYRTQL